MPSAVSPHAALDAPSLQSELVRAAREDALIDDPPVVARGSRGANETGYIREAAFGPNSMRCASNAE